MDDDIRSLVWDCIDELDYVRARLADFDVEPELSDAVASVRTKLYRIIGKLDQL